MRLTHQHRRYLSLILWSCKNISHLTFGQIAKLPRPQWEGAVDINRQWSDTRVSLLDLIRGTLVGEPPSSLPRGQSALESESWSDLTLAWLYKRHRLVASVCVRVCAWVCSNVCVSSSTKCQLWGRFKKAKEEKQSKAREEKRRKPSAKLVAIVRDKKQPRQADALLQVPPSTHTHTYWHLLWGRTRYL